MNANVVNVLNWSKPTKSIAVLLTVNFVLWTLIRQRPFFVLPIGLLVWYCRQLWRHRIRPEVLVDPPDVEEWISLSTYDLQQVASNFFLDLFNQWLQLREDNHLMWTIGTCTGWIILAKIGMEMEFLTLLFILANAAFIIYPALDHLPKFAFASGSSVNVVGEEDLMEISPPSTPLSSAPRRDQEESVLPGPEPVLVGSPPQTTSQSFYGFYEGMLTRSMASTALKTMSSSVAAFNIGGPVSSITAAAISTLTERQEEGGGDDSSSSAARESLSPAVSQMPDHDLVDSDPEDDFLFDAKHFDKSSSSTSVSNSFEIIEDDDNDL